MKAQEIPKRAMACVYTAPGEYEIREVDVPEIGPTEVLCKIGAAAICGCDPEILRGDLAGSWPPAYPHIAGHEWSGEVVAIGAAVNDIKVGDKVAGQAHKGCSRCENCKNGRYTLCLNYGDVLMGHRHYGFVVNGAFCQYEKYESEMLTVMPKSISFAEGSMVDTIGVAMHGIDLSGVTAGGTVVVIGPGPIGISTMRVAKACGSAKVIVIGRGERLQKISKMGADHIVDFTKEDIFEAVNRLTGGLGADEVFECSGAKGTFEQSVRMVRKGGKVVLLGVPPESVREEVSFKYIVHNEIAIFGSRANPNVSKKVVNLMASGQVEIADVITHTFPLEKFGEAIETFITRKDGAMKVVLLPNGEEDV